MTSLLSTQALVTLRSWTKSNKLFLAHSAIFIECTLGLLLGCKPIRTGSDLESVRRSDSVEEAIVNFETILKTRNIERKRSAISSAVMLLNMQDIEKHCGGMVDEAKKHGAKQLAFIPTFGFEFTREASSQDIKMTRYCVIDQGQCRPFSPEIIERITQGLSSCFQKAVNFGFGIALIPHIDDANPNYDQRLWRNLIPFDPLAKYDEKYSYDDILISPLTQALKRVKGIGAKRIDFAMQGEMGATVFNYPDAYTGLLYKVRNGLKGHIINLKTGISLNGNRIAGNDIGTVPDPNATIREAIEKKSKDPVNEQLYAIKNLFREADFIGMSHYGKLSRPGRPDALDFDNYVHEYGVELLSYGINLADFFDAKTTKEFHLSEFGHGGISPTSPWEGTPPSYDKAQDPWQLEANQAILCGYYEAAGLFLSGQSATTRWGADKAFIWNLGSWDIQGIYHESKKLEGTYKQKDISEFILHYNQDPTNKTLSCRTGSTIAQAEYKPEPIRLKNGYYVCRGTDSKSKGQPMGWIERFVNLNMAAVNGKRSCIVDADPKEEEGLP
jgi:hypothetical protein